MKNLQIGYSFYGWLGDTRVQNGKEVSAPDGNSTYSYTIINELQKRGHDVWTMMPNRDAEAVKLFGKFHFKAFSQDIRWNSYTKLKNTFIFNDENTRLFPKLDILLVEWRFPIVGRNINEDGSFTNVLQKDLMYQQEMLRHYKETNTKIIVLDLDHKLTVLDEGIYKPDAIFETSEFPVTNFIKRTSVKIPTIVSELLQFETTELNNNKHLVYVGSRYERDEIIDKYIKNYALNHEGKVQFYGNWRDYPEKLAEAEVRWKGVQFNSRIGTSNFYDAYSGSFFTPLLGKQSYFDNGFITARIFESVLFDSLPLGFNEHNGIQDYVVKTVGSDYKEIEELINELKRDKKLKDKYRKQQVELLEPFDVTHFVDKMMEVL